MAKSKKESKNSSFDNKKAASVTKNKEALNSKKAEIISEKLNKMNKNFETIISECQSVLQKLTQNNKENVLS